MQRATPIVPNIHESTSTATLTTYKLKAATVPPMINITLNPMMIGIVTVIPLPPIDQALEYIEMMAKRIVQNTIYIRRPPSKVLVLKELLQITL